MPSQRALRILALAGKNVREGLEELEQVRRTVCGQKDLSEEERLFLKVALSNGAMMEE